MIYKGAHFISNTGDIIEVHTSHIAEVIRKPELFGWTLEDIKQVYEKHHEMIGIEGKARTEILIKIIHHGWIRLRRYKEHWGITVDSFNEETKMRIQMWALEISDSKYTPVKIMELSTNQEYQFIFSDFLLIAEISRGRREKFIL